MIRVSHFIHKLITGKTKLSCIFILVQWFLINQTLLFAYFHDSTAQKASA